MTGLFSSLLRWAGAASLALAALHPAAAAAPWHPNDDDALLLELRSGAYRIGTGVRGYDTPAGICVDLSDMVMALDLPVRVDPKSRRATGWAFTESRRLLVDRDSRTVQIMNNKAPLAPGDIIDTPEGWCVATDVLARWLGVELIPDRANALLTVKSPVKLPFELAEERKARAARLGGSQGFDLRTLPQQREPYRAWRTPSVDAVVSLSAVHDNRFGGTRAQARYELYATGEIAKVSVDARLASDDQGVPRSLRVRGYRTDPHGNLLGPLHATQVAAGDVTTPSLPLSLQSAVGRGVYVSNRPVDRPDSFDRTSFYGALPAGWDAELYRNGELIAVSADRGDGRYAFVDVRLLYGQNRFEVVLYGPQGQVRREIRTVPVGLESIPPRKTYWWAGALQAGHDLIDLGSSPFDPQRGWRGGVGVERGLDIRTSAGMALTWSTVEGRRRHYAEAELRRAIGSSLLDLGASAEMGGALAWRAQWIGQFGQTYVAAETNWTAGGYVSDRFMNGVDGYHALSADQLVKIGSASVPLHLDVSYTSRRSGRDSLAAGARASFALRSLVVSADLAWTRERVAAGLDPPDALIAGLRASGRIGRVRVRGETRLRLAPNPRLAESDVVAEWSAGRRSDWRAEIGYDAELARARAGIGLVRRFDRFALTASVEAASDGSVAAGLDLSFSLGRDPVRGGVRLTSTRQAASGAVLVTVFRDSNANGRRDPGEPLVKGVDLTAGLGTTTTTDAQGHALLSGLEPFRAVLIGIDAGSLSDPYLQPRGPGLVIEPRPGVTSELMLPLVASGSVEGNLQRPGGVPLAGVAVELVDAEHRVVKTALSEYDGYFLFEGVPYGRYTLRIAPASAAAARVQIALSPAPTLSASAPAVSLGVVLTSPAPTLAQASP